MKGNETVYPVGYRCNNDRNGNFVLHGRAGLAGLRRGEDVQATRIRRDMNRYAIVGVPIGIVLLSGSGFVWQAWIASPSLSPAQDRLLEILDWAIKLSLGALVGYLIRLRT